MSYAFLPHAASIAAAPASRPENLDEADLCRTFALVDVAQFYVHQKPVRQLLPQAPTRRIFEDSFAQAALHLSPLLIELGAAGMLASQLQDLDEACADLPMVAVLSGRVDLDWLLTHLRDLLLVEANGSPYLLRFADTQMMWAFNSVLAPAQRARVFHRLDAWWTVDHDGTLRDLASPSLDAATEPAAPLPLELSESQTQAMLAAAGIPILASQIRTLDNSFARLLDHAGQSAFAADCIAVARSAGVDEDADLLTQALECWRVKRLEPGIAAPRSNDSGP